VLGGSSLQKNQRSPNNTSTTTLACTGPPVFSSAARTSYKALQRLIAASFCRCVAKPKVLKLFYGRESFGYMMVDEKMVSSFYSPIRQTMDVLAANPLMEPVLLIVPSGLPSGANRGRGVNGPSRPRLLRTRPSTGGRDRWHVMVKIWRPTQDLARRVFAVVYEFVVFIHSLSSAHLFYKTTQNRPLTAMI